MSSWLRITAVLLLIACAPARAQFAAADFFAEPDLLTVTISPDGTHLAAIAGPASRQELRLIDALTGEESTLLRLADFSENDASLLSIGWVDDETIAAQFSELRAGVETLLDTRSTRYLLLVVLPENADAEPEVLSVRTYGNSVDLLPEVPGEFLYAKSGRHSRVYRLRTDKLSAHKKRLSKTSRIDGGQFVNSNSVAQIEGFALRWFVGENHVPVAAMHALEDGDLALSALGDEQATTRLATWSREDFENATADSGETEARLVLPVAYAQHSASFYCLDYAKEEQRSVYRVDYEADSEELIYEADSGEIVDLVLSQRDGRLVGVKVLRDGDVHTDYLDSRTGDTAAPRNSELRIEIEQSLAGDRSLFYVESHSQPGQFWLAGNDSGPERLVGGMRPHLTDRLRTSLIEDSVTVDGLDIPYLLTLPRVADGASAPLIVLPHGGPIGVFDTRYFDSTTQFLAANDYAVLRVNFRGSSGYTAALREAGKRQWGDLMLRDIHTATETVAARDDIDENRVCAFGLSYGGYAATMLAILHPDRYRCAVNVAGVSDINLYLQRTGRSDRQEAWLREYVGDSAANYDGLKAISPAYLAGRLERPLLIMHGAKDSVVDIEQAWRLKHMLDKHQKPYDWHVFPDGEHSLRSNADSIDLYTRVDEFMRTHLH